MHQTDNSTYTFALIMVSSSPPFRKDPGVMYLERLVTTGSLNPMSEEQRGNMPVTETRQLLIH